MKLRVHGNSIRLRLRKSEIARFAAQGKLTEALVVGSGELGYRLIRAEVPETTVELTGGLLVIQVPAAQAREWCESDEVGIYAQTPTVEVILEKEFRRTSARTEFDEDLYPNPRAGKHFQQIEP
ncbi:MAG: hypothetical protein U5J83_14495 [Bryobacterales bacterium]|nr:hypothetical protein [Bryobacterales bacterium]